MIKRLIYIVSFVLVSVSNSVWSQKEAQWLMFEHDTMTGSRMGVDIHLQKYCCFLNIESDTNRFALYEYGYILNHKKKKIYFKFEYEGSYFYSRNIAALRLNPNAVEISSRVDGQLIKEEKVPSEHFTWDLYLDPYHLILMEREVSSIFSDNSFFFALPVCQALDKKQFIRFNSEFEHWNKGEFKSPEIDTALLADTNKYFIEIPHLNWESVTQIEQHFYSQGIEKARTLQLNI